MPETILTATWNAVKKPPEWLGKKTVDMYDKFRFPKLTPEEKKMKDKIHAILKKHYKAVGWTETAIAVGVTTWVVVKGKKWLEKRRRGLPPSVISAPTADDLGIDHGSQPVKKQPQPVIEVLPERKKDPLEFKTDPKALLDQELAQFVHPGEGSTTRMWPDKNDPAVVWLAPLPGQEAAFRLKMAQDQAWRELFQDSKGSIHIPWAKKYTDTLWEMERCRAYTIDLQGKGFVQGQDKGFFAIPAHHRMTGIWATLHMIRRIHQQGRYMGDVNGLCIDTIGTMWPLDRAWIESPPSAFDRLWKEELMWPFSLQKSLRAFITRNNSKVEDVLKLPFLDHMINNMSKFSDAGSMANGFTLYRRMPLQPYVNGNRIGFRSPDDFFKASLAPMKGFDFSQFIPVFETVWQAKHPGLEMGSALKENLIREAAEMTMGGLEADFADVMAKKCGLTT